MSPQQAADSVVFELEDKLMSRFGRAGDLSVVCMAALTASFAALPRPLAVVYSALKDKQGQTMAKMLQNCCDRLYVTQFAGSRADSAAHLAPAPELIRTDWKQAVREAREFAGADGAVVITGSLYFISDARAWLLAEQKGSR